MIHILAICINKLFLITSYLATYNYIKRIYSTQVTWMRLLCHHVMPVLIMFFNNHKITFSFKVIWNQIRRIFQTELQLKVKDRGSKSVFFFLLLETGICNLLCLWKDDTCDFLLCQPLLLLQLQLLHRRRHHDHCHRVQWSLTASINF